MIPRFFSLWNKVQQRHDPQSTTHSFTFPSFSCLRSTLVQKYHMENSRSKQFRSFKHGCGLSPLRKSHKLSSASTTGETSQESSGSTFSPTATAPLSEWGAVGLLRDPVLLNHDLPKCPIWWRWLVAEETPVTLEGWHWQWECAGEKPDSASSGRKFWRRKGSNGRRSWLRAAVRSSSPVNSGWGARAGSAVAPQRAGVPPQQVTGAQLSGKEVGAGCRMVGHKGDSCRWAAKKHYNAVK